VLPALPVARQARIRHRLGIALADFVARLHDAGIVHHDFHASNVLLHLDADDTPRLHLIDLHAVSLGRPLDRKATRANLVMLNRAFTLRTSRAERFRFWRRYRSLRPVVPPARELEAQTHLSSQEFWSSRDRRSLVNNRYYRRLKSESITGHAVTDFAEGELAPLLTDPDAVFSRSDARLLKDSRSSTVAELELSVGGVLRRVIFKRFRVTAWHDPWTALVRRSPAVRSWVWGHGLRERDLPTPRPLAVFHRIRNGLPCEGYLLTEKVENAVGLREHLATITALPEPERRQRLRHLIDRIARLLRALHERGLTHRDLKAANILMAGDEPRLIDLVGVRQPRRVSRRERVRNLARLNASFLDFPGLSRSDRLRFLRVYLQFGFSGRDRWKRWWAAIDEVTRAKAARNARRGRVLA
jgi:tRNA A-37 threonylcarbamoyl transferase component Bud32